MHQVQARRTERGEKAFLIELYSGVQGEGILVGERMVFLRFTGCNLTCDYCDTQMSRAIDTVARIERTPGARDFETVANPIDQDSVLSRVTRLAAERTLHRYIAVTGGEPLLYARFIRRLAPGLAALGLSIYLETNGTLPAELERVLEHVEWIAMGVKEEADGASLETAWRFLGTARARKVFVKSVVRKNPDIEHYRRVAAGIRAVDPGIPFVLQPVTPYGPVVAGPAPGEVLELQRELKRVLPDVRVIPQTHKLIGQI
ncbi:MAG: 7-carboxy-7-deazaguanine synthase QueE [Planctomycetes bacterium]|nr:7-carboxy-7-deazaguanine synthase QueE [Planctomycetota bacterium]